MKFKVGDRVRCLDTGGKNKWLTKGKEYIVSSANSSNWSCVPSDDNGEDVDMLYGKFELIGGSMSKYDELKERIDNVTAWDKEADDILQEISNELPEEIEGKYAKELALSIKLSSNSEYMVFTARNCGIFGKDVSPLFNFKTQCEKLLAFKQALHWLLDHSDIKKDLVGQEVKAEIEGKIYKVKVMGEI